MVGPPHSGILPSERRLRRGRNSGRGAQIGHRKNGRQLADNQRPAARRRRPRHMVLVLALAHLALQRHPRTGQRGIQLLLPDERPRHRPRHPLLLGGPHDYGRIRVRRQAPLPQCLLHRHRPRQNRPQDVEIAGQLARPARTHRQVRCRRRTHGDHAGRTGRQRHPLR